jgi:hypothetical protein
MLQNTTIALAFGLVPVFDTTEYFPNTSPAFNIVCRVRQKIIFVCIT